MPGRFNPDDYVDVQERINRFWTDHANGAIVTRLMSPPDDFDRARFEAQVFAEKEDNRPAATGYAFELAGGAGANQTSHEENCETSAIGRALANLGYSKNRIDRPSRQEMAKAAASTAPPRSAPPRASERVVEASPSDPAGAVNLGGLHTDLKNKGFQPDDVHPVAHDLGCAWFGIDSLAELTPKALSDFRRKLALMSLGQIGDARLLVISEARRAGGGQLAGMPQIVPEYGS